MITRILVGVGCVVAAAVTGKLVYSACRKPLSPFDAAKQREEQLRAAYVKAEAKWLALSTEEVEVWRAWMAADAAEAKRLYAEETRLKAEVAAAKAEMDRLSQELYHAGMARVQASFTRPGHDLSCNIWHDASENAPCTCSCA